MSIDAKLPQLSRLMDDRVSKNVGFIQNPVCTWAQMLLLKKVLNMSTFWL